VGRLSWLCIYVGVLVLCCVCRHCWVSCTCVALVDGFFCGSPVVFVYICGCVGVVVLCCVVVCRHCRLWPYWIAGTFVATSVDSGQWMMIQRF